MPKISIQELDKKSLEVLRTTICGKKLQIKINESKSIQGYVKRITHDDSQEAKPTALFIENAEVMISDIKEIQFEDSHEINDTTITSINDYFDWLEEISSAYNSNAKCDFLQSNIYYRGQADREWELTPSLFRWDKPNEKFHEHELINAAVRKLYKQLLGLRSNLEKLVYLQHYGLPTRLLDVTFNPLIALYFACQGQKGHDGAVYCGYKVDEYDNKIINTIADYIFNGDLDDEEERLKYLFKTLYNCNIEKLATPNFLLAPFSNPRIKAQDGAFIMAPLFKKCNGHYHFFKGSINSIYPSIFDERRAIIPSIHKNSLLQQLSMCSINEGTIYQGAEHEISTIKQDIINKQIKLSI